MAINAPLNRNAGIDSRYAAEAAIGIKSFFSAEHIEHLQSIMQTRRARAGTALFWEGDETGKLYYIRSGRVKLRKSTEEGKDFILSIMQKGDLIGEFGMGVNQAHSFSAEVSEHAEIGVIQWKDLETLLCRHSDFALQFMNWMNLMQRVAQSKLRDLLLFGKPGGLASTLIRLANSCGVLCADGIRLDIKLTNAEMADFIGTTRESVNRMLNALKKEGTIDIQDGMLIIRRLGDLRRICCCPSSPACPSEVCRI